MMREKKYCPFCGNGLARKFCEGALRLFCSQCQAPVYENPVPATCLVVVDDQDRLVLVQRSVEPKIGCWCLPGGFIELGETPEQAALRELKEETGLNGQIEMLLGVYANPSAHYQSVLMIGYLVRHTNGALIPGDDAMAVDRFRYDQLPEIAFDSHLSFIRIYFAAYAAAPLKPVF